MNKLLLVALCQLCAIQLNSQTIGRLTDSLHYTVSMQSSLSAGDNTPLWLSANRYGLSSLKLANGYLRGAVSRPLERDSARCWGVGYTLDVALAGGFTSALVVQQAFVDVRWKHGLLTVGSKEYPMELKNSLLSSGPQALGVNSRPVPQLRLSLPDYWPVPFLKKWLAVKGHVSYGLTTDSKWQREFTHADSKYTEHSLLHTKAGYMRIGSPRLNVELGLEMACQFGGTSHVIDASGERVFYNDQSLKGFLMAFTSGGSDASDGQWKNNAGNHLGSWVGRLNIDRNAWAGALYFDRFFEDHSAMLFVDYDGYGSGADWDKRTRSRYFFYDVKDAMLGAEVTLKRVPWLSSIVVEYLCTKYQSGPVYHDHTKNVSDHISGRDDYYNHYLQTGWQHWGMVSGNPLYLSPLYNSDHTLQVENNRFVAWHAGIAGNPLPQLSYRVLFTWQRGYGTYLKMFRSPEENVSMLAEATYRWPRAGWQLKAAAGFDSGGIYGHNRGFQLTVSKSGILSRQSR